MTDLEARLEAEHRDLTQLPHHYANVYTLHHATVNVTRTEGRGGKPSSRWPAGRDPQTGLSLASCVVGLTVAHGWCQRWRWPARPWTGPQACNLVRCRECKGSGVIVEVDLVDVNGVDTVRPTMASVCYPCDGSGTARHDVASLKLIPLHPNAVSTYTAQLRSYLAGLMATRLNQGDVEACRRLLHAAKQARTAVAWVTEEHAPSDAPQCAEDGCGRMAREGRTLCHRHEKRRYQARAA